MPGSRQSAFPEFVSGVGIKSAQEMIGGRANEGEATGRAHWATEIRGALNVPKRPGRHIPRGAQRHLPIHIAGLQIDAREGPPGWRCTGHAER